MKCCTYMHCTFQVVTLMFRLLSNESYRKAEQLFQIWIRQLKLWIPESLMTTLLLHLHLMNQLNSNMKVKVLCGLVRREGGDIAVHTLVPKVFMLVECPYVLTND